MFTTSQTPHGIFHSLANVSKYIIWKSSTIYIFCVLNNKMSIDFGLSYIPKLLSVHGCSYQCVMKQRLKRNREYLWYIVRIVLHACI